MEDYFWKYPKQTTQKTSFENGHFSDEIFEVSFQSKKFHSCAPQYDLVSQKSFTHEFNNHHKD